MLVNAVRLLKQFQSAIFCCLVLWGASAYAEEPPIQLTIIGSSVTSFSTKIQERDRLRETQDAASLFEGVPGLRVRRLGAENGFATLSIRGTASNQIRFVLAGIPLNGAADPSLDLATLPLWPSASVRVFRSFAPASFGGGYLGGLVHIDALNVRAHDQTEWSQRVGSFGSFQMRISDTHALQKESGNNSTIHTANALSASRSDGNFTYYDPLLQHDRSRTNNGYSQVSALHQTHWRTGNWSLLFTAFGQTRRDQISGTAFHPLLFSSFLRERILFAIEAQRKDEQGRWLTRIWNRNDLRTVSDPIGEQNFSNVGSLTRDHTWANGVSIGRIHRWTSSFSTELRADQDIEQNVRKREFTSAQIFNAPLALLRRRTRVGLSLDATYKPTERWAFHAAMRSDLWRDTSNDVNTSLNEWMPMFHVGTEYQLGHGVSLAAHAGTLARPPSFLELLGDNAVYVPAINLKRERAWSSDVGLQALGQFLGIHYQFGLIGFVSNIQDLIVFTPTGLQTLRAENVGQAFATGIESTLSIHRDPIQSSCSYTFLSTQDRTQIAASSGNPLPGRPMHDFAFNLGVRIGPIFIRYGVDLVASTTLDRAATLTLPMRIWHSVGMRTVTLGIRGLTLSAEILNLFDQRTTDVIYQSSTSTLARYPMSDFIGFPLPGRRGSITLRWEHF